MFVFLYIVSYELINSFKYIIDWHVHFCPRHNSGEFQCVLWGMSLTQTLLSGSDKTTNKCWETVAYVSAWVITSLCVCYWTSVLTSLHVNVDRCRKSSNLKTFSFENKEKQDFKQILEDVLIFSLKSHTAVHISFWLNSPFIAFFLSELGLNQVLDTYRSRSVLK